MRLAEEIAALGPFELHHHAATSCRCSPSRSRTTSQGYTVFDVSNALRERGWQVPAYTFPANRTDLAALRVVVRRGFSHDLADLLLADLSRMLPRLEAGNRGPAEPSESTAFAH